MTIQLRKATQSDVQILRRVFIAAGEGIAEHIWARSLEDGQSLDDLIDERMRAKITDPQNTFWVAEVDGTPAGGILSYNIDREEPLQGLSPLVRSLVAFENDAVGSHYVNALAVFDGFRRMGVGSALLAQAAKDAKAAGNRPLTLGVNDANAAARATYAANGFTFEGAYPILKEDWDGPGKDWLLLRKAA